MSKVLSQKYSAFSKAELIELLEEIPDYQVYLAARVLRDNAFNEQSEAYTNETIKLIELQDKLRKNKASCNFESIISEINSSEKITELWGKKYEKFSQLCIKLSE